MRSLKELFRIGKGPSSSHTMGPQKASQIFKERNQQAASFEVTLYGSLAATGKGHMTDAIIVETLEPTAPVELVWQPSVFLPFHPNGMKFVAKDAKGNPVDEWTVYSIGGGALSEGKKEGDLFDTKDIYDMNTLTDIMRWCEKSGRSYWEYVEQCETADIWDYLHEVWTVMQAAVERGLNREGVLPGPLGLPRKAATYYVKASGYKQTLQTRGLVYAYALAVSEENASGGTIVTAPTCGASGVLPAVLYHLSRGHNFSETRILHALATAGLFGNVVKDRICCGNGFGTPFGHDLRPRVRFGTDTLHRTKRFRSHSCIGFEPIFSFFRRQTPRFVRPCGRGYETDWPRYSFAL